MDIAQTAHRRTLVMEAEYISFSDVSRQALTVKQLCESLNTDFSPGVPHRQSRRSCCPQKELSLRRVKYIDIRYLFIRSIVKNRDIKVVYAPITLSVLISL